MLRLCRRYNNNLTCNSNIILFVIIVTFYYCCCNYYYTDDCWFDYCNNGGGFTYRAFSFIVVPVYPSKQQQKQQQQQQQLLFKYKNNNLNNNIDNNHQNNDKNRIIKKFATSSSIIEDERNNDDTIQFISPLLIYGYKPTVDEYINGKLQEKPLLLYLPGFDGTYLSPFLQFPELGTIFNIQCMTISQKNRSTFNQLINTVVQYLLKHTKQNNNRPIIYIAGESFGGILASAVTLKILEQYKDIINIQGIVLINPATCYNKSQLAIDGPMVAQMESYKYPIIGLPSLLPLFTDEYSIQQLLLILKAEALPSIIDNECREAYMGRVAFSLPFVLPYMEQETLQWRLNEWLKIGCDYINSNNNNENGLPLLTGLQQIRTLIVVGEKDLTLPSVHEAERLKKSIIPDAMVHIVKDAGHASTCGSRVDLTALFRARFHELVQNDNNGGRTTMKETACNGIGPYYGMEPRYDNATIGLNPLQYWNTKYYRKYTHY